MHSKDLTIRFYRSGDESQINRLFEAVFHINRSIEEWRWKFQDNPLGKSVIIVGELDNKIVAHSAAIPIAVKIGDEILICYQSLDSMSDPATYKKFIFPRVFKRMQEEAKNMQQIYFGLTNKKAHALLTSKRLRVMDIGKIDIFSAKLSAIFSSFPGIKQCEFNLTEVNEFDDRFTYLWGDLSSAYKIAVIREREYLNWRYVGKPNNNYNIFASENNGIKGYIVLKIFESNGLKIGSIIDLFVSRDPMVCSNILGNALVYFNSKKVDLVVCYHRDKFLSQCLLEFGFSAISDTDYEGVFSQMWLVGRNFCPQVHDEMFMGSLNWFFMMGDSDWM